MPNLNSVLTAIVLGVAALTGSVILMSQSGHATDAGAQAACCRPGAACCAEQSSCCG
jgi:hypothetical protein